ncbi:alpha/beta fold hydrolase [Aeromicrobium wangtongii]|uniref:alpha/beta fold hydrolase n=1 Tax=Aeromicrobium wangtongii TaxID=2969247 RepID=UPI0020172193|nr:alpha/beta hydrolase [Aeromicrobium wangtongii]MCL3819571.1 alpha/beta hydrolase [Aeromicrobium wangtongii]
MSIHRPLTRTKIVTSGMALAAVVGLSATAPAFASSSGDSTHTAAARTAAKPTIVLVHGAWADSSSFAPVTKKLQKDGYTVLSAPNPLRGLRQDSANVATFVNAATKGPVVLVGHSYGGSVITNAATKTPRVKALVYVDAYAPAKGESVIDLTGAKPGSAFAVKDPTTVFNFVPYPNAPKGDVDAYVKPELFKSTFAAKLPTSHTKVLAAGQRPIALSALQAPSKTPAWKKIKSYFFVGTRDRVLPAAQQIAMAKRADGVIVTRKADHLSMLEKPKQITTLIERAARHAR